MAKNIVLANRVAAVVKVVTAYTLTEEVQTSSVRLLVGRVKAISHLIDAGRLRAAHDLAKSMVGSVEADEAHLTSWHRLIDDALEQLVRVLEGPAAG